MSYSPRELDLDAYVRRRVAGGFHSPRDIRARAIDVYEVPPSRAPSVDAAIDRALAEHDRARASWPEVTDCDRLDAAFVALDDAGVLARHDYSCCQRCGHREIADLVHDERERGRSVDGYVFYHSQDTDRAAGGASLHLRYAASPERPEANVAIGRRVVEALRARGLEPTWTGDPDETIELRTFDWKRRAVPAAPRTLYTPRGCRDTWCALLPRAVASDFARALGEGYAAAAVEMDRIDVALAWAKAPLPNVIDGLTRWRAASCVASALVPSKRVAVASELLIAAYASAMPRDNNGLVDLLVGGHLDEPAVREAARARVAQFRMNVYGAAAAAWLLVRSEPDADLLARLRGVLDVRKPDEHSDEDFARTALAAALWVLLVRSGDVEGARRARAIVFELAERPPIEGWGEHALRASIAAAREVGELDELLRVLCERMRYPRAAMVEERVRAGSIDGATADATAVRIARDDPRAEQWAAGFEEWVARLEEELPEGLADAREVHDARLDLAAMSAALGRRERAAGVLSSILGTLAKSFDDEDHASRAHLDDVRRGACAPLAYADDAWLTPEAARAADEALEKWKKTTNRHRTAARRECTKVLNVVAALARSGQLERARELYARVEAVDVPPRYVEGATVAAWVAMGELDRAVAYAARSPWLRLEAVAPLVAGLVAARRRPEALAILGASLGRVVARRDLVDLAPAVLAVADDPRECAEAMLASWQRADVECSRLAC